MEKYNIEELYKEKWKTEVLLAFKPTKTLVDTLIEIEQKIKQYDRIGFGSIFEQTRLNSKIDSEHIFSKTTEPTV